MSALADLRRKIKRAGDPDRAAFSQRYFKTGPGEYAAGDRFAGLTAAQVRAIAREFRALALDDVRTLIASPIHEHRLVALLILVSQYRRGDDATREAVFNTYLASTQHINNWDLVDCSAEHVIGPHLRPLRRRTLLTTLAKSKSLWDRRIAIMSTFHYIRHNEFAETLRIARLLLRDTEDLVHKAVGWMLREVGKRNLKVERAFLDRHARQMPRTMLRYAIERFPEPLRKAYLAR
jgi:3-methyladenine DNA glycosylase AlkD